MEEKEIYIVKVRNKWKQNTEKFIFLSEQS